jgi:predicted secreted hydrolase
MSSYRAIFRRAQATAACSRGEGPKPRTLGIGCLLLLFSFTLGLAGPYETAQPGYPYQFPRDHFDHPAYQTEWWYYTGNVRDADGHRFGFELTFFRQGLDRDAAKDRTWDVQDIYLAHLALSDLDGGRFYHAERLNRRGPGIAGASEAEQKVWNGNWQIQWHDEVQHLQAMDGDFALELNLHPEKPPVIHGENGVSQKAAGAGHASHYISLTRVATRGEITLKEKTKKVSGVSWMDHEFFTTQADTGQRGWDWLGIQLADNTELMLYRFRRKDGTMDPFSSGTFVDAQAHTTHLRAGDFTIEPSGQTWKSPSSGAVYPVSWKIQIPRLAILLEAKTQLPSQELSSPSRLAPTYWEGAITLTGSRDARLVTGVGYLELTGYDAPL